MERHDPRRLRRARRIARLAGALAGLLAGVLWAAYVIPNSQGVLNEHYAVALAVLCGAAALGLLCGLLLGPVVSIEPYLWVQRTVEGASASELLGGALGLIVALVVAALVSVPLLHLPDGLGVPATFALTAVLAYVGVGAGTRRLPDLLSLAREAAPASGSGSPPAAGARPAPIGAPAVVDTSVLIDGRVLDVARTGFLSCRLMIPGFVLEELQRIADSGDPVRRAKGRRGLATVEGLRALGDPPCEVVDVDFPGVPEVDSRLVRLARAQAAALMTNDYMLNRLAQIEGMRVLNVNDLALALKPIVSAGEQMQVTVVKEGKELHQGVGYLDDGTMVVVENGRRHLDETVTATVTSVIQTPAGRMIFALVPPAGEETRRTARATRVPRVAHR